MEVRVLLVEDDEVDMMTAKRLLRSSNLDCTISEATLLSDALEIIAQEESYDCILLDNNLPDGEGIHFLEGCAAVQEKIKNTAFILITGTDDAKLGIEALQRGMQDYIPKDTMDKSSLERSILYAVEKKQIATRLKKQQAVAEGALASQSNFLLRISHEIRTPLNAIMGFSQLLMDQASKGEFEEDTKGYIKHIHEGSRSLSSLISNLLRVAQLEGGQVKCKEEAGDLREFVSYLFESTKGATGTEHKYTLELSDKLATGYYFDREQLSQALIHILNNAQQFTSEGKGVALNVYPHQGQICFSVIDEGEGINKEEIEEVFALFSTKDGNQSIRSSAGIGLTMSKLIVENMGGTIKIESERGAGTTVTLTLPLTPIKDFQPEGCWSEKVLFHEDVKVLLVDDSAAALDYLKALLGDLGIRYVTTLQGGLEAFELQKQVDFDLIILDVHMPRYNGLQATEAIREYREQNGLSPTPILLCTGDSSKKTQEKIAAVEADGVLYTPIQRAQFLTELKKHLKHY